MNAQNTARQNAEHAREIVEQLLKQGVREAVISPGSRNTPLVFAFDAAARQDLLRVHVVLDERVAGFLALGLARRSGQPVALSCTSGSAGAHYLPAIMEAAHAQICLVALTADRPEELQRRGAPQTTEQSQLFAPHVHETLTLAAASDDTLARRASAHSVERALAGARAARKPLHINAAFREPLWDAAHQERIEAPYPSATAQIFGPTLHPSPTGLDALRALRGRGLFVVGPLDAGVATDAPDWLDVLRNVSAQRDWPIAADAVSPVRQRSLRTLKHLDILLRDDALLNQDTLDHLVLIGPWPTSKALGLWLERNPEVEVTCLPGALDAPDPWHRVTRSVRGDISVCLAAMRTDAPTRPTPRCDAAWACDRAMDAAVASFCSEHPVFEGSIARTVVDAVHGPATLHISSSMPIRDVDAYADGVADDVTLCASRGVNGIDGNIATVLGEALAAQEPGVLLIGDLAFRHDISGLMHAAQQSVNLSIVVIDNAGGGIFRHLGVSKSGAPFGRYFLTPQHSDLQALAQGVGARTHAIDDASTLRKTLARTMHSEGIDVLIVPTDGTQQVQWRNAANARALQAAHEHPWTHIDPRPIPASLETEDLR